MSYPIKPTTRPGIFPDFRPAARPAHFLLDMELSLQAEAPNIQKVNYFASFSDSLGGDL